MEIGKNAEGNEKLVTNAKEEDILLHTKAKGSSFINIGPHPSEDDIKNAATLCALKSQDWRDNKGDVIVNIFKKKDTLKDKEMPTGTFGIINPKEIVVKADTLTNSK